MTVGKYQITKDSNLNDHVAEDSHNRDAFSSKLEIMNEIKDVICESIISNSDVYLIAEEEGHNYCYEPKGQEIEVALAKFLVDNNKDLHEEIINREKNCEKLCYLPFDQNLKRKTVVRKIVGDADNVRVYVKGAPEYIFQLSNETLDDHNQKTNFTETQKDDILNRVISQEMAAEGLKVLSFAFKDISLVKLNEMMH